jgi:uncharacterized protein
MDVTPLIKSGTQIIQSYADGRFRISGQVYDGPVLVLPEVVTLWSVPLEFPEIGPAHFEALAAARHEVVLFGTGRTFRILPPAFRAALKSSGMQVDAMDTGAACRTYNVLVAEGRRVAAALLPVI